MNLTTKNNVKIVLTFFLLIWLLTVKLNGQHIPVPIHLKYKVSTTQLDALTIKRLGLKVNLKYKTDFEFKFKNKTPATAKLYIESNGLYKILDGYNGHIIFLEEGDSAFIQLNEIPNIEKLLETKYYPSFNKLTALGQHAWHYTFFDALYKRTERLYVFDLYVHLNDPMLFKKNCDEALVIGQQMVDSLYKKNKISTNFRLVALEELNAIYVANMCKIPSNMQRDKINPAFFEKLNTMYFNDSAFAVQCNDYLQAGALYTYYIHNSFNFLQPYSNLSNEFSSIIKNYSGIVRDKLLGWQIQDHIGKDCPAFDSCYKAFLLVCKNEQIKEGVIKKVNSYVKPVKNISSILFSDLLERSMVLSFDNKKLSLANILNDSLVTLVDCWASWCSPCKAQMPFVHDLEKKYAGKIKVIYLSFDKDENRWNSFLNKNKLTSNQYLMANDFSSDFSQYFDLQIIPRYILLSKSGKKVLNATMPLPSMKEACEKELEKLIGD